MKNYLLLILTLLFTSYSFTQVSTVKGRVLDSNGFALPGATIQASPSGKAVVTDFDGFYTIVGIEGDQTIKVSYIGFETVEESVTVDSGATSTLDFTLETAVSELAEVVVSGFQSGIIKGLNKQKSDINVTNVVSADQIGKFPDDNVGDVIKRIAGVSMQGDQGEARNIVMRGLGPGQNSVTLNGDRVPSAEGDNRNVQLDLIPSAMIQSIEVNKTLTPDMEADAIGGSVNLITRSNPSGFRASATLAGGGQPVRDNGFNSNLSFVVGNEVSDKFSYSLAGTVQTKDYGSDNIEFEWNDPADWADDGAIGEMDIRRYDVKRTRRSLSLNLDYNIDDNNQLFLKTIYNHRDDWENRFRLRVGSIDMEDMTARIRRQTKGGISDGNNKGTRLEDQRTQKYSLGGDHLLGGLKLDWKVSYSEASEDRPDERYVRYEQKDVPFSSLNISNPERPYFAWTGDAWNNPSDYRYRKTEQAFKTTNETNTSFSINLEKAYSDNDVWKIGFKFKDKTKMRDDIWYEYDNDLSNMDGVNYFDASIPDYLAGDTYQSGYFVTANTLGMLSLSGPEDPNFDSYVMDEFAGGNYDAEEQIAAFYAMIVDKLGDDVTLIAGARFESTSINYTGQVFDEEEDELPSDIGSVSGGNDYYNILPNLTLQWDVNDELNLNIAFTQSIARPSYYDLVPYEYSNSDDQELALGNPDLKSSLSTNFDFMGEWYFGGLSLLSFGYFSKDIKDWIYQYTTNNYTYAGVDGYELSQLRNGEKANVSGFELGFQTKFLKNFTFMGNYTSTDSSTNNVEGRDDVPLTGQVDDMYNLSLAFENKKFFVRASMNYASEALDELSGDAYEDRYYDEQTFVDVNANYKVNDNLSIFAEGKNLTNQPLRYYQGIQQRTMQIEYYNLSWTVGLKYDF